MAVEQGLPPHERSLANDEELEEERRLCFVGMSAGDEGTVPLPCPATGVPRPDPVRDPEHVLDEPPADVERIDKASRLNAARSAFEQFLVPPAPAYTTGIPPRPQTVKPVATAVSTGFVRRKSAKYAVGMVVQHEQYGIGQVSDVSGLGP